MVRFYFAAFLGLAFINLTGCFNSCGVFGATDTSDGFIVHITPLQPITVGLEDSVLFRPEEFMYVAIKQTGNSDCSATDYDNAPDFGLTNTDSTLALIEPIAALPNRWPNNEQQFWVKGNQSGTSTLTLTASWYEETTTDPYRASEIFEIEITVTE